MNREENLEEGLEENLEDNQGNLGNTEEANYREINNGEDTEDSRVEPKTENHNTRQGSQFTTGNQEHTGKMMSQSEENNWASIMWLSNLIGFFTVLGFGIPIVMWALKKDESRLVNETGAEIINVLISYTIYSLVATALMIVLIGFLILPIIALMAFIFFIVGGVKSANGEVYRVPFTIRFIK